MFGSRCSLPESFLRCLGNGEYRRSLHATCLPPFEAAGAEGSLQGRLPAEGRSPYPVRILSRLSSRTLLKSRAAFSLGCSWFKGL
jgi:hypothetical protein